MIDENTQALFSTKANGYVYCQGHGAFPITVRKHLPTAEEPQYKSLQSEVYKIISTLMT